MFGCGKKGKDRKGRKKISAYTLFGQKTKYIWRERKIDE